ncbi:hypothetical protein CLV62_101493 [Dysgonomonas alginatilytica]|uniref:Uncharacterized protein n=1 Tax=Dysgonomonas alginatilytica TaxID=1605892 RepID=A0A2V3PWR4_9BACT|nr:hypothetical protein [Dysgonomonas alginatilytica]PXV69224.1 hypothetical protein CLV62_101493 [Dysgonomonas alginatilytica]
MKTDLYTKTILTVIAVCLTVNLLKEFEIIPAVQANTAATAPAPIPAATQTAPIDVNITHIGGILITTKKDQKDEYEVTDYKLFYRKAINIYDGFPVRFDNNNNK